MWSIYTTANKAIDLIAKEKLAELKVETNEKTHLLNTDENEKVEEKEKSENECAGVAVAAEINIESYENPDLKHILHDESSHFTLQRVLFTLISFGCLFTTSILYGSKAQKSELPDW